MRTHRLLAIALVSPLLSHICASAQTNIDWAGPAGGNWSDADNWMPMVVPHNIGTMTYAATVNTNGPVVDGIFTIAGLSVGDQVLLGSSSNLGFGTGMPSGSAFLNGNGSVNIAPGAMTAPTAFTLQGGHTLTISGNGSILLGGLGTARVLGGPGSTIDNQSWRIVGEGNFIEGFTALHNGGTITASDGRLVLNAAGYTNSGLMGAVGGATLQIGGGFGSMTNSGTIRADAGGMVQLSGGLQIDGGTLTTMDGGSITTGGGGLQTYRLSNLTNAGRFVLGGGATLELLGAIDNRGSISLPFSTIRPVGTVTLSGGGTILMSGTSLIAGAGGGGTLVNLANTISGAGQIHSLALDNEVDGTIRASGGTLTIAPGAGGLRNTGIIEGVAGGTLELSGSGTFHNADGRIVAGNDTVVRLVGGATINHGTLGRVGNGSFLVPSGQVVTFRDLTLEGELLVDVGSGLRLRGDIVGKAGHVRFASAARARIAGVARNGISLTMESGSAMDVDPDDLVEARSGLGPHLINEGLIEGAGTLSANILRITNDGTITANAGTAQTPGLLWIDPNPEGMLNAGVMESDDFGVLVLSGAGGGSFAQTGTALVRALGASSNVRLGGTTFSLSGGMLGSGAGSIAVDGGTTATISDVTSDALLTTGLGIGTIVVNQNVVNNGTISLPSGGRLLVAGASTLNSASGHIQSNGSITINNNGNLDANFIAGTGSVLVQDGGTLRAHSIRQGRLAIDSGGFGHLKSAFSGGTDPSRVGSLSIGAAPAFLDLANRVLIIDQSGTVALNTLRNLVTSGYNGGTWDGFGIRSSSAAANPGHGIGYGEASAIFSSFPAMYFGETIDNTTLLMTYTRYGDANLDRVVNLQDFNRLAANFGQSNKLWTDADFTYDGIVNLQDFNRLAANFGLAAVGPEVTPADWAALAAAVPEPAGGAMIAASLILCRRRRIRRGW